MLSKWFRTAGVSVVFLSSCFCRNVFGEKPSVDTVYRYSLVDSDGKQVQLSDFRGKVLLIVNLASKSIFEPQVAALEALAMKDKPEGLVVIGIPSNDFGAEEPESAPELKKHYLQTLHVTFPLMERTSLRGKDEIPLYSFLTQDAKDKTKTDDVHWNYTKFIVDRKGRVAARFEAGVTPDDPGFQIALENALKGACEHGCKPVSVAKESPSEDERERSH